MKKLSLKPNAFDKGEVLTRGQLRKVMGGFGSGESGVNCTYYFKNGSIETGTVNNPPGSGYAFAHQYAEAFCANDPTCAFVDCGR